MYNLLAVGIAWIPAAVLFIWILICSGPISNLPEGYIKQTRQKDMQNLWYWIFILVVVGFII